MWRKASSMFNPVLADVSKYGTPLSLAKLSISWTETWGETCYHMKPGGPFRNGT